MALSSRVSVRKCPARRRRAPQRWWTCGPSTKPRWRRRGMTGAPRTARADAVCFFFEGSWLQSNPPEAKCLLALVAGASRNSGEVDAVTCWRQVRADPKKALSPGFAAWSPNCYSRVCGKGSLHPGGMQQSSYRCLQVHLRRACVRLAAPNSSKQIPRD